LNNLSNLKQNSNYSLWKIIIFTTNPKFYKNDWSRLENCSNRGFYISDERREERLFWFGILLLYEAQTKMKASFHNILCFLIYLVKALKSTFTPWLIYFKADS